MNVLILVIATLALFLLTEGHRYLLDNYFESTIAKILSGLMTIGAIVIMCKSIIL